MRDVNRDTLDTEAAQEFQRVLCRHPEPCGERWCRDQRRRGEDVDSDDSP
jgi:hypothetical protein